MKKKILFTIENLGGGGAEKILLYILNNLDRARYDITLFLLVSGERYEAQLKNDIKVIYVFQDPKKINPLFRLCYKTYRSLVIRLIVLFPVLIRFLARIDTVYDVGISFCEGLNSAIILENRSNFKKKLGWIHIDFSLHKANISNRDIEKYYAGFDEIAFVSNKALQSFEKVFPTLNNNKFKVLYNPINTSEVIAKSTTASFAKKKFTIISVGRFTKQKRFDRVIQVAKMFSDNKIDAIFYIIGEGKLENEYHKMIEELHLGNSVYIFPFQENVVAWVQKADVFLMTSDYEGLPVALCEAMLLNKPIVSTRVSGTEELLENGKYGILTEKDIPGIFIALKDIVCNEDKRNWYINKLKANQENFIFKNSLVDVENFIDHE